MGVVRVGRCPVAARVSAGQAGRTVAPAAPLSLLACTAWWLGGGCPPSGGGGGASLCRHARSRVERDRGAGEGVLCSHVPAR